MIYDVYCVGLRLEKFSGFGAGESEYDEEHCSCERYRLFCTTRNGCVKFIITLENTIGWCGSGYTTASWGYDSYQEVTEFGPATHLLKDHKPYKLYGYSYDSSFSNIMDAINKTEDNHGLFIYEDYGDEYYPDNYFTVNMDLFEELPRAFEKRPVWIFTGDSATGKSTIGYILKRNDMTIFETDALIPDDHGNIVLPDEIWADVIVFGRKWKNITLDDIKARVFDAEIIIVNFEKSEK